MPSEFTLTLFIPDLFGFQSTLSKLTTNELSQLPEIKLPVLEKWFSRGLLEKSCHQDDFIFSEFGLSVVKDNGKYTDKPYAALALHADNVSDIVINQGDYWLRADPVNLQADRDTALLAAHEELALTQTEANKLVEEINRHFIDEPWQLYAFAPHRWYLRLEQAANLFTTPLAKMLGEDINQFGSTGDDADYWFKIMNELQMLLHGSVVNFERESRNMWTANSLWLWGGGCLPEKRLNSAYDTIITNDIIFSGLANYCGVNFLALDTSLAKNIETNNNFVVLNMLSEQVQRRDLYTFVQTLNNVENTFLIYCNELLLNGSIAKIKIMTDAGLLTVTKKHLGRWWKRIKPFASFNYA